MVFAGVAATQYPQTHHEKATWAFRRGTSSCAGWGWRPKVGAVGGAAAPPPAVPPSQRRPARPLLKGSQSPALGKGLDCSSKFGQWKF